MYINSVDFLYTSLYNYSKDIFNFGGSMKTKNLPGTIRERITDWLTDNKTSQAELASKIGISESSLNRFLSGKTDKLGNEYIIKLTRVFGCSADYLLGETDIPERIDYNLSELELSVQSAKNLYTKKVNPEVVNLLLESENFAEVTYLISRYLNDDIAKGIAAQNQLFTTLSRLLGNDEAAKDIRSLRTLTYAVDLTDIQNKFMRAVKEIKSEKGNGLQSVRKLTDEEVKKIYSELTKDKDKPLRNVTPEELATLLRLLCREWILRGSKSCFSA